MRTVILVPRRAGVAERDRIWAWCRARWETLHPDLPVYEGHHDEGPFNRSLAINRAAANADVDGRWDQAVIVDGDVFIDPANVRRAIARAAKTGRVTWAFQWWAGLTHAAAADVLDGRRDPELLTRELAGLQRGVPANELGYRPVPAAIPDAFERINPVSWSCCLVVPRAVFEDIGGFDERFRGWGWEDLAFQAIVCGLYGHERIPGAVVHLWHPRSEDRTREQGAYRRAYVLNRMLGRRYMYALRVRGMHDRPTGADDAEMEQDRQNVLDLARREELTRFGQPSAGLPDWRNWWPSLEELRESWRRREPAGPPPRISVIVRTGGTEAAWPARKGYLERAIASLTERVRIRGRSLVESASAVRLVVYSDWPAAMRPELEAIAQRHGFYVVGEGNRGFTPSMQRLWRYLGSRPDPFEYVFLAEDDFVYERDVDLAELVDVLAAEPHLVQVALLRDACYPAERERGGILGHPLEAFAAGVLDGRAWLEHRRFFTVNPTLFRRSLLRVPWPGGHHSEALFGNELFRDPNARSALWGEGEAWVRHIGEVRAGAGY